MEEQSSTPPTSEGSSSNTTTKKQRNDLGSGAPRQSRPRARRPPRRLPAGHPEAQSTTCTDYDRAYFKYYSHVGVHEEMLKDHVRTETYKNAILKHQSYIEGKVVLDVGCGIGILSIFCAQAGAKRVYAVDASEIAMQAARVVKANNLSDRIVVLNRHVEDAQISEKVDVIISEWMGYMLLYESILGSVIFARNRWLKPGGLILPSNAALYMGPVTHPDRYAESIDFWRNVYGIDSDVSTLPLAKQCAFEEPCVETISGENLLSWPHEVRRVNCYTVTNKEVESITTSFKLRSKQKAPLHGFAFWFDVEFRGPANNDAPLSLEDSTNTNPSGSHSRTRARPDDALVLSTSPKNPATHWQQTVVYFDDPIEVEKNQVIDGSATLTQCKENNQFMDIHLEYASGGHSVVKKCVLR